MEVQIADIRVGTRHRKDLGDLQPLADSIAAIGLLHPIVVKPNMYLVVGERRIEACKLLGRTTIEANVAHDFEQLALLLKAESDENTCRKEFNPSEAVEIGKAIEEAYRPKAEKKQASSPGRPKKGRGSSPKISEPKKQDESTRTTSVAAASVGMDRRTYEKAVEVVDSGNDDLIAEMNRTGKVSGAHKKLKRQQAVAEIQAEPPPLPVGPFRVIVADPPWQYDGRADDPTHRAANPYPSMSVDEIAAMPVASIAGKDAVLWLWVTNSHLPVVWPIIESWGFEYKTCLTWVKNKMGTGDWLRGKTEHCLLCVRGRPTINLTNQTTAISGNMRKHSEKPEEFYLLVEQLCPGSKCELFARQPREGYAQHGNEV